MYYFLEYQPSFREDDRADSTFQETAQTFESLCCGQVDLVEQDPVAPLQCRNQGALRRKEMFYLTTHSTHFIYGYMEGRKEMFYLTTHSTHFIYGYMASDIWLRTILIVRKERERNVLFNDALNTFYLWLYGVRHMVKDHSDSEKGNLLPPHRLLFPINSKGSFICTIPQTG